jgi:hypothetical protein
VGVCVDVVVAVGVGVRCPGGGVDVVVVVVVVVVVDVGVDVCVVVGIAVEVGCAVGVGVVGVVVVVGAGVDVGVGSSSGDGVGVGVSASVRGSAVGWVAPPSSGEPPASAPSGGIGTEPAPPTARAIPPMKNRTPAMNSVAWIARPLANRGVRFESVGVARSNARRECATSVAVDVIS